MLDGAVNLPGQCWVVPHEEVLEGPFVPRIREVDHLGGMGDKEDKVKEIKYRVLSHLYAFAWTELANT